MLRSLQWKLVVPLSLLIAASLAVLGIFLAQSYRDDQMSNLRQRLTQEARLVAHAVSPLLTNGNGIDSLVKELGESTDIRITVIDPQGSVLGDSLENPSLMENHLYRPEVQDALTSGYGESIRYSTTLGQEMLYVAVLIPDGSGGNQAIARVALPLSAVLTMTGRIITTVAIAVALAIFLAIPGAWIITRIVTQPVVELTHAVMNVTTGSLGQTISTTGSGEISELARAFNTMSFELAKTVGQLSKDKETITAVLSHIADGVLLTDESGNIVLCNHAAALMFDFKETLVLGKSTIEAVRDHQVAELIQSCLKNGQETSAQFDSSVRHRFLHAIALPLTYGKSSGVLLLFQDLTELKGLQTMRKELIGNISHEFRTPLAGIKAMVETLQDGALQETSVAHDFLRKIAGETDRLTQMVVELGELSRIESDRPQLKKERVNLNQLAQEVTAHLIPLAERQGLVIKTLLTPDLPLIDADRERLRHVLVNLLHNAIKFTPPGGHIEISSRRENDMVIVEIEDTGIGIAPEAMPHVFERFYKVDWARAGEGSGLGLAIVKHTIQAHGGRVWAESTPGKGSIFSFSLPAGILPN